MSKPGSMIVVAASVAAGICLAATGSASAMGGNSGSGSGLSPYAVDSGNDRSAGVNNGNYAPPRYNYYRRTYGPRDVPYPGHSRYYEGYAY